MATSTRPRPRSHLSLAPRKTKTPHGPTLFHPAIRAPRRFAHQVLSHYPVLPDIPPDGTHTQPSLPIPPCRPFPHPIPLPRLPPHNAERLQALPSGDKYTVTEIPTKDGALTGAITAREVATLAHESGDDAVELGSLEALHRPLSGAQLPEVL